MQKSFNETLEWRPLKKTTDDLMIYEGNVQTALERDVDFRTEGDVYEAYISENELERIKEAGLML